MTTNTMKLMKTMAVAAMLFLGAAVGALAFESAGPASTVNGVPPGVWTGTYNVGQRHEFVRIDFAASQKGDEPGAPDIVRFARTDLVNIVVDGSQVRFGLPHTAGTLAFEGTWDDGIIRGAVEGNGEHGTFVLQREVSIELEDYMPLIGSYRMHARSNIAPGGGAAAARLDVFPVGGTEADLPAGGAAAVGGPDDGAAAPGQRDGGGAAPGEPDGGPVTLSEPRGGVRTVLVMTGSPERARPAYFENDRLVMMFPVAHNTFISELGEWLHFDPASPNEVLRIRTLDGNVYAGIHNDEYREEPVGFANGDVHLAGSLLVPAGARPFPAVIIIHGSQGDDRQVYRHYADHFARQGIAALIYDKRGTGSSSGNWRRADIDALTGDALAAADFLRRHPDIDPHAIGVWGISQGGWIVAQAAQRDPDIAFVIGVSAAGTTPGRQEAFRIRNVLVDRGLRGLRLELALLWHRLLYPLGHLATKPYVPLPKSIKDMAGGLAVSPFFNPIPVWRQVRQPVLLLYGEVDFLVDPVESPELISAALTRGGNPPPTVLTFDAADHSIRLTETGRPSEVLKEFRFAPGYFEAKSDWIWSVVRRAIAAY